MGPCSTTPKRGRGPINFRPISVVAKWLDRSRYTWHGDRPQPKRHCVTWGPSSPSPKGAQPQFSVHIRCGQMVGWIKTSLGREVGLSPCDIVLDWDPAAPAAHVYCGHGRPPQLLLSSCYVFLASSLAIRLPNTVSIIPTSKYFYFYSGRSLPLWAAYRKIIPYCLEY